MSIFSQKTSGPVLVLQGFQIDQKEGTVQIKGRAPGLVSLLLIALTEAFAVVCLPHGLPLPDAIRGIIRSYQTMRLYGVGRLTLN